MAQLLKKRGIHIKMEISFSRGPGVSPFGGGGGEVNIRCGGIMA